jgi:hypothetical protein
MRQPMHRHRHHQRGQQRAAEGEAEHQSALAPELRPAQMQRRLEDQRGSSTLNTSSGVSSMPL